MALVGTIRLSSFCTQGGERQIGVMKNANIYIYIYISQDAAEICINFPLPCLLPALGVSESWFGRSLLVIFQT